MALSNQRSPCIVLSFVLVMLQMLLLQTSAISVSASPAKIHVGLSPSLDVNCTHFIKASSTSGIISLAISRNNNFELASITIASEKVYVISSEGITADGVMNPGGQSYIHLHWDYPTNTQVGKYQCIVQVTDSHTVLVVSNFTEVIQGPADQADMMTRIREMDVDIKQRLDDSELRAEDFEKKISNMSEYIKNLEHKMTAIDNYSHTLEATVTKMDAYTKHLEGTMIEFDVYTKDLEERILSMNDHTAELEQNMTSSNDVIKDLRQKLSDTERFAESIQSLALSLQTTVNDFLVPLNYEDPPFIYQGKIYYVSKSNFTNFHNSSKACMTIGGHLAEVDDNKEYHAIQEYLTDLANAETLLEEFKFVFIGGTDEGHDGHWVLPSTDQTLPLADWYASYEPTPGERYNCLCLNGHYNWRMMSYRCQFEKDISERRYMCEVADT